jgi:capsule polysaccharide export protein KpsE/RkpR
MATKEITKPESRYDDPDLEQELAVEAERSARTGGRTAALLALLWRERRFLYRCAAYGLVFSTIIAFLLPVRYTSTTRLMPPDQAGAGMATMLSALTKAGGELGALGTDLLGIRTSSDLFVGVLHSRSIQDDLINKFDLRRVYGVRRWEDARKTLEDRTEVSADRKSEIITIKVSDKSPQRAAELAHEYTLALNNIVLTLNVSAAHKERVFLEKRLGQVQQDLEAAEKDFGNFASKNTAIDVKEQGKAMIGAAAEIEGELIAAQTQLEGLRQIYNPNNVRVRSLQAQVDEYRKQLQKLGGKSQTADSFVPPGGEDLYPSIRELPILGVQYADLYRRAKVQEAVFEILTKQYEMAKVEEARETPSVKILDDGDVPERKSFPPRLLLMLLGTIFVVIMGGIWLRAQERWQEIDPASPGKILANDVSQTIRTRTNELKRRFRGNHSDGFGFSRRDGDGRDSKEQDNGRSKHDTQQ